MLDKALGFCKHRILEKGVTLLILIHGVSLLIIYQLRVLVDL